MANWLRWFGNLVWQPEHDSRVDLVQAEVDDIKRGMADLKQRTEALEAFHKLAKDAER